MSKARAAFLAISVLVFSDLPETPYASRKRLRQMCLPQSCMATTLVTSSIEVWPSASISAA